MRTLPDTRGMQADGQAESLSLRQRMVSLRRAACLVEGDDGAMGAEPERIARGHHGFAAR